MAQLTLGDVRRSGASLAVECLRCGAVERRDASTITGSDTLLIAEVGLTLSCTACGAKACIVSAARNGNGS